MDTAIKQERANNKKSPCNPTRSATRATATEPGNSNVQPAWKFKNFGKITTYPDTGVKYKWCKLRGRVNDKGVQNGIYMLHPHNHEDWSDCRAKYNADWKEKQ